MKFHNNPEGIRSSIAAREAFKTTSYWRHTLIWEKVVGSPDWNYRYQGNYIIVTPKS